MIDFTFYTDNSHGWLGVPIVMIKDLEIQNEISKYSYFKNNMAYLEEDCDAPVFLNELKKAGLKKNQDYQIWDDYRENQPIRNYSHFSANLI
jgi:hypothetical protein